MEKLHDKIKGLSTRSLIKLSREIQQPVVPENALIREVIKGTEVDTVAPILAFIAVGSTLAWELGDRLEDMMNEENERLESEEQTEHERNINCE